MNFQEKWKIYRSQRPGREKKSVNYCRKDILFTDCSDDQSETVETARKRPNEDSAITGLIKRFKNNILEENIFEKLAKQGPSSTSTNLNTFREYLRDWEASSIKIENFTSENYFLLKTAKTATKVPEIITISDDEDENEVITISDESENETENQTAKEKQTNSSATYEANKKPNTETPTEDEPLNQTEPTELQKENQTDTIATYESNEPQNNTETPTPTEDEPLNQTLNEPTELQKEKQTDTDEEFQYIYDSDSSNESQIERETPHYTLLHRCEVLPTPTQMRKAAYSDDSNNNSNEMQPENPTTCNSDDEEMFHCPQCYLQFHKGKELKTHMLDKHNINSTIIKTATTDNYNFHCEICKKGVSSEKGLILHKARCHKIKKKPTDQDLSEATGPQSVERRVPQRNEPQNECVMCKKKFYTPGGLNKHNQVMHNISLPPLPLPIGNFQCDICNKSLPTEHGLKMHYYKLHKLKKKRINYLLNEKTTETETESTESKDEVSEEDQTSNEVEESRTLQESTSTASVQDDDIEYYECYVCLRDFKREKDLKRHLFCRHIAPECKIPISSSYAKMKFCCLFCKKEMASENGIRLHLISKHSTEDKEKIENVLGTKHKLGKENTKSTKYTLRKENTETLFCPFCVKPIQTMEGLKEHMDLNHKITLSAYLSGVNQPGLGFRCFICGEQQHTKRSLHFHLKKQHQYTDGTSKIPWSPPDPIPLRKKRERISTALNLDTEEVEIGADQNYAVFRENDEKESRSSITDMEHVALTFSKDQDI